MIAGKPKSGRKFPAVVLVHGGGGKAFPQWVAKWAEEGYAAIAMDLGGKDGEGAPLPNGGPDQTEKNKILAAYLLAQLKNIPCMFAEAKL